MPNFAAFIAVCAFAGLRRGEASALKVGDSDFLRKQIRMQLSPPIHICGLTRTTALDQGLKNTSHDQGLSGFTANWMTRYGAWARGNVFH